MVVHRVLAHVISTSLINGCQYGTFIIPRKVVGGFPEGIASRMTEQRARESELQITVSSPLLTSEPELSLTVSFGSL